MLRGDNVRDLTASDGGTCASKFPLFFLFKRLLTVYTFTMQTRSIRQTIILNASANDIYDALMDETQHTAFTESQAHIDATLGGAMDAYDGYITGRFLELEPNARIVQIWRAEEDGWPEEHFSTLTITLTPRHNGTAIGLLQTDVPEHLSRSIAEGWKEYYWKPLRKYLERKKLKVKNS